MSKAEHPRWQVRDRILEIRSKWVTLIGEQLEDDQGHMRDYWRVERVDSVIVLPLYAQQIIMLSPTYRPGVGTATLDFPGGRLPTGQVPSDAAVAILARELGVEPTAIAQLSPLNSQGWAVDSAFSTQRLHGFVAEIQPDYPLPIERIGMKAPATAEGIQALLSDLNCLQCRAVLLEWGMGKCLRALQDSNL